MSDVPSPAQGSADQLWIQATGHVLDHTGDEIAHQRARERNGPRRRRLCPGKGGKQFPFRAALSGDHGIGGDLARAGKRADLIQTGWPGRLVVGVEIVVVHFSDRLLVWFGTSAREPCAAAGQLVLAVDKGG